jgi:hypothetical protein
MVLRLFMLIAIAILAMSVGPAQAADFGPRGVSRSQAVRPYTGVPHYAHRARPRNSRFVSRTDWGVFYPYRNYWDRYANWDRFEGRYYHGPYAYRAEPFPDGFWWW